MADGDWTLLSGRGIVECGDAMPMARGRMRAREMVIDARIYVKNCPSHSEAPSSRRARDEEQTCERPKNKTQSRVCGVCDPRHDPSSENPRRGVQHTTPLAASLELQRVLYYSAAASPVEHASDRPAASSCAACWLEEYGRGVALRRKEVLLLVRAERRARTRASSVGCARAHASALAASSRDSVPSKFLQEVLTGSS